MAGRRRQDERIEPNFGGDDGAGRGDDFRLSADDRAVRGGEERGARRKSTRMPEASPAEPDEGRRRRRFFGGGSGGSRPPRRRRGFLSHIARLVVFVAFWGGLAAAGTIGYFAMSLPPEAWNVPARPPNVKIVSVTGEPYANRGTTGGEAVTLAEMSPFIPKAVIAIEDRRFYDHWGVDPFGILRALAENMAAGQTVQGGSTLTQQLAKNIFLNPEQTLKRKGQEAVLALWLERKFTKDQILEMYLNRVYFGSGATGVEAASQRYFGKSAKDVTLNEAALLAGLLKAPSRLSPARDPEAAKARADVVLQAMLEEKSITPAEYEAAKAQKPIKAKSAFSGAQNYAADIVMRDLTTLVGEVKSDVIVETTIDLGLEKDAEKAIAGTIDKAKQNVSQGALVAIDGTGAIRALVGGRDYADSQFNRAVDAKRQPGSAFKPFVYETALEAGWRPESVVNDQPTRIGNWEPQNYDQKFRGPVTLADALAHSLNTVAAQLTANVGSKAVIDTASRMGVKTPLVDNASIALGTSEVSLMELTGAFAPFANGGYEATPHLVNRVTDVSGKVLYERPAGVPPVIVSPEVVAMMNAMLEGTITKGTGRRAALKDWQAAGKTGTTQDFKDAWFIGYTANLTTGVWLGNDNGAPMKKVTGGTLPAEAWHAFMAAAHQGLPPMPLPGDYRIGGEHEPLTASVDPNAGGAYDTEMAPGGADPNAGLPPDGGDIYAGHGQPESQGRPRPRRGIEGPADEDVYGVSRLPDERDVYGDGGAYPPDDPYYEDGYNGGRMRGPEEIAPARGPSRLVRRETPPPGAILEGPVEEVRPTDRSLFRGFFGG